MRKKKLQANARAIFMNDLPVIPGSAFFLVLSSFLILVSLIQPQLFAGLRNDAADRLAPVLTSIREPFIAVSDVFGNATGLAALQAENARLMAENERLREWYQKALALEVENQSLHSLLNVRAEPEWNMVTVRILSDTANAYAKTILIAAGTDQNIRSGQPVLSGAGVLGRVIEVGDHTARVLLLTDLNARIPVVVEGSNTHAILAGSNDNLPILTHLAPDTLFRKGQKLLTSGLGGMYPAGLPVGVVYDVINGQPFVMPYSDIDDVHHVRVITRTKIPDLRINGEE